MKIGYRKKGDAIELGAECAACMFWRVAEIPVPGALGMALRVMKDGGQEIIDLPDAGTYVGCPDPTTCPNMKARIDGTGNGD